MQTIYVLGSGAIGFPLAAYLVHAGRAVVAVRTSRDDIPPGAVTITVDNRQERLAIPVETVSLAQLPRMDGIIVVASKAYANPTLAQALIAKQARGAIVLLQNGIGVEAPFCAAGFPEIYRCVLYLTSQTRAAHDFTVRPVAPSPIGIVSGDPAALQRCVDSLHTQGFPLRAEARIAREVWKKALINTVFNSLCPLLDSDNGIFAREPAAAELARDIVAECLMLTDRLHLDLSATEVLDNILLISARSDGQAISTLQDLRNGRPTEIAFLNQAIVAQAAKLDPPLELPKVALLGRMIATREQLAQKLHGSPGQAHGATGA
jgi:2-dehydropantoate 2-reductase